MSPQTSVYQVNTTFSHKISGITTIACGPDPAVQQYHASPNWSPVGADEVGATRSIWPGELLPENLSLKNSYRSSISKRLIMSGHREYLKTTICQRWRCRNGAQADGGAERRGREIRAAKGDTYRQTKNKDGVDPTWWTWSLLFTKGSVLNYSLAWIWPCCFLSDQ